jgi:hypothetical protein
MPIELFDRNHNAKVILLLPSNEEKLTACSFLESVAAAQRS